MAEKEYPYFVYAKMWEAIQPIARSERYEDPLEAALEPAALGEVSGGGSSIDPERGIVYVGIDIDMASLEGLDLVRRVLEDAGAPKGSELHFEVDGESRVLGFGRTERITLWLDGVTLPDEVYELHSTDALADEIEAAIAFDPHAEIRGSWQGPRETAIYIHGSDSERLFQALEPVLNASPGCQNARVIIRDGSPTLGPREIRIPMRGPAA